MTSVHVNRSLKALRAAGLIAPQHHAMRVPDLERLAEFCGFQPDYLHLTAVPACSAMDPSKTYAKDALTPV